VLYILLENPPLHYVDFKLAYVYDILIQNPKVVEAEQDRQLPVYRRQHFQERIPSTPTTKFLLKRCVVCQKSKVKKQVRYQC